MRLPRIALGLLAVFHSPVVAQDLLPDGDVAKSSGQGIVEAWYAQPTDRYEHGILGDFVEAGSLAVVDDRGHSHQIQLPVTEVFEDITPRIADLDGDGNNEVVTIRTTLSAGASVAIYEVKEGRLIERAATAPIGQTHRWLSIAAIDDFVGDGSRQIAVVKTPHIGGVLEILALRGNELVGLYPPKKGYSTHFIGSRTLSLAVSADFDGDGAAELALPDQTRCRIIVLRFGLSVDAILERDLPACVDDTMRVTGDGQISVPLETGETFSVSIP